MKARIGIALLVAGLLVGCGPSYESAVIGSWKGEPKTLPDLNPALTAGLLEVYKFELEIKAINNEFSGQFGVFSIEGTWVVEKDQLILTPTSVAGGADPKVFGFEEGIVVAITEDGSKLTMSDTTGEFPDGIVYSKGD